MKHKLATLSSKNKAQQLADALHQASDAPFFVSGSGSKWVVVFDDLNGFYGGLNYKKQFVKGWVACQKRVRVSPSLFPASRRNFLLRLKPLTEETSLHRKTNLPRWIKQEKARIAEATDKLKEAATKGNTRLISFWSGRLLWAKKQLAALEDEKKGFLVPMVDNGIVLITREDIELIRLWSAE